MKRDSEQYWPQFWLLKQDDQALEERQRHTSNYNLVQYLEMLMGIFPSIVIVRRPIFQAESQIWWNEETAPKAEKYIFWNISSLTRWDVRNPSYLETEGPRRVSTSCMMAWLNFQPWVSDYKKRLRIGIQSVFLLSNAFLVDSLQLPWP